MAQIKIAILDDHQIIIDGLKLLLEREDNIEVVLEHTNGHELLAELANPAINVDVLLMDLMMPNIDGYEMAVKLQEQYPAIKIIILSMNTQADYVYKLVEFTDIRSYLPKTTNKSTLLDAIHDVQRGLYYFPEEILAELHNHKIKIVQQSQLLLTQRELEIINLIAKGMSTKEMAQQLYLSEHTITTHRKNILRKTDTHNVASLIDLATKLNLLQ